MTVKTEISLHDHDDFNYAYVSFEDDSNYVKIGVGNDPTNDAVEINYDELVDLLRGLKNAAQQLGINLSAI